MTELNLKKLYKRNKSIEKKKPYSRKRNITLERGVGGGKCPPPYLLYAFEPLHQTFTFTGKIKIFVIFFSLKVQDITMDQCYVSKK